VIAPATGGSPRCPAAKPSSAPVSTAPSSWRGRPAASGCTRLQLDLYHCQIMEGDLASHIERLLPRTGHVQIAGNPGRHEPDRGEINYPFLFDLLDEQGYDGWVGCEYRPHGGTVEGLGWAKGFGLG
jgi:hydroxypyruvate isomerase